MGTMIQDPQGTAWDVKLDKMLDDLKTTVRSDDIGSNCRRDLMPQFSDCISTSDSQNLGDDGYVKHYHKEYTSPDQRSKMVSDQYEYEQNDTNKHFQKKLMKSTYTNYSVKGGLSDGLSSLKTGPDPAIMDAARPRNDHDEKNTYYTNNYRSTSSRSNRYDFDELDKSKDSGDVKKIVWRNRYEKSYEGQDGTPLISVENESKRQRHHRELYENSSSSRTVNTYSPDRVPAPTSHLQLQYAVYFPSMSPGSHSWTDAIPIPTPPQVSPKGEPGVAYVYSYGEKKSHLANFPAVNYTTIDDGTSPTPSKKLLSSTYHDSLPLGKLPEDIPKPPVVPMGGRTVTYDYKKQMTRTTYDDSVETSDMKDLLQRHQPLEILNTPCASGNRDVTVTINKYTNYSNQNRSRSSSPDRIYSGKVTHVSHTTKSHTDSVDRLRKQPNDSMPFPDTSPITHVDHAKIPTQVDELMSTISPNGPAHPFPNNEKHVHISNHTDTKVISDDDLDRNHRVDVRRPETKNVAGPAVYYPPGHKALFDESMHTMSLKEGNRRGRAKWRMEKKAGYKESGSSSDGKNKVGMVPVCLPLCCGAACVLM